MGFALLLCFAGCSSSDCPLNNTVMQKCGFYNEDGSVLTISDTLTISIRDSVILNRLTDGSTIMLPMSYSGDIDTLVFHYKPQGTNTSVSDTIIISKTNSPHFVSLDCARSMFHTITGVKWSERTPDETYRYAISDITIRNNEVNYDEKENLQIYFAVFQ